LLAGAALFGLLVSAPRERAQAQEGKFLVKPEQALLEVDAPGDVVVTVRILGTNPPKVEAKTSNPRSFEVKLPDEPFCVAEVASGKDKRTVLLQRGRRVLLPMRSREGQPELVLQTGHTKAATAVAFSADGKWVLTGSRDRTALLWDAATGQHVRTLSLDEPIQAVAFSPDGKRVAATGSGAVVWEGTTGKQHVTLNGASGLRALAFSPDGKWILTGSHGHDRPLLWDAATGQLLSKWDPANKNNVVNAVAFSPDGKSILAGRRKDGAVVCDRSTGAIQVRLTEHAGEVTAVAFSADGKWIVTGGDNCEALLWEVKTGKLDRDRILKKSRGGEAGHTAELTAVCFSPDGKLLLTGAHDGTAILWDVRTGEVRHTLAGGHGDVLAVAFAPDGKWAVTACEDGPTILWDVASGRELRTFGGSRDAVHAVAVSSDGKQFLTASQSQVAVLWDAVQGRPRPLPHGAEVHAAAFRPDGTQALTGGSDGRVILWNTATGERLHVFASRKDEKRTFAVRAVAFSPNGRRVLIGAEDGRVALWAESDPARRPGEGPSSWQEVCQFARHTGPVTAATFSSDGKSLLTASRDGRAILWTQEGAGFGAQKDFEHRIDGRSAAIRAAAFGPDGRTLLTGAEDGSARLWEATGKLLHTFKGEASVFAAALSSDGRLAAAGFADGRIGVWDTKTGARLRDFPKHTGPVMAVAFAGHAAHHLLSGGSDNTARLWDVATSDELARLLVLDRGKDWLVTTTEGLFDGSTGGEQKVAYRLAGRNVVPVERFFQDFYAPGLLAVLARGERPQPTAQLARRAAPLVRIVKPQKNGVVEEPRVTLEVEVADQGGGIAERGPRLVHNNATVFAPGASERDGPIMRRRFTIALVEGENKLEVRAASADGSIESEPARLTLRYEKPLAKALLHVVAVGINEYRQPGFALQFAADDARAMGDLFKRRGKALYADVKTHQLLDARATRAGIRTALEAVAKEAKPQDTILVFFAGHGAMVGQRYFFIPHEFKATNVKTLEEDISTQGLPGDEVLAAVGAVPALKRVVIFDTCHSGGAVGAGRGARDPFAFRGAIERLSRSQGVFTMAGAAESDVALEEKELGHGVLTYALLAGLGAVDAKSLAKEGITLGDPGEVIDVLRWFSFASEWVPRLTRKYFSKEQDVQTSSHGDSFPLLPASDR
jgi:WD40 repeat protein